MYIVLILLLFILLFTCYVTFKGEILYPPVVAVAMFLFCSLVGLLRYSDWNMADYSGYTVIFIMLGLLSFIGSSFFVYKFYPQNYKRNIEPINKERIEISAFFLCCNFAILMIHDYLSYKYILLNAENLGFYSTSLGVIINFVRNVSFSEVLEKLPMPSYLLLLNCYSRAISIFAIFVLVHNAIFQNLNKQEFLLMGIILLDVVNHLLDGSRGYLLIILAEVVYLCYFFWNMQTGWKKSVNKKILKLGFKFGFFLILVFVGLAFLLGRYGDIADIARMNVQIFNYLTIYIGSAIRNFDLYVQEPLWESSIFGKETFFGINSFLYNRFGIGEPYFSPLEFRFIYGASIGNIYTAFRRYYADFGIIGLISLPAFLGFLFTYLYNKAKYYALYGKITYTMIFFSALSNSIFYFPIEDWFFVFSLKVGNILSLILLFFIFYFQYKKKIVVTDDCCKKCYFDNLNT